MSRIVIDKDFLISSREPKIKASQKSTEINPDEDFLNALIDRENDCLRASISEEPIGVKRKLDNLKPVLETAKMTPAMINEEIKHRSLLAKTALTRAMPLISEPAVDIEALHKQDLQLAEELGKKLESPGNPHWQGFIWNPAYAGAWWTYNGEGEEKPGYQFWSGPKNVDIKSQAYGEGWFDGDYSKIHGYLGFKLHNLPSWGILRIYVPIWVHGYYSLYSNDEWWNSEYARATLHTWVDVHQNFWRPRQYAKRFNMQGDELHPTRYGRIDTYYPHTYRTTVGSSDTVTIRAGALTDCYARAGGTHSILNLLSGNANYIYIPYIYWYLYH